jgi:antirestriction protein ArdC
METAIQNTSSAQARKFTDVQQQVTDIIIQQLETGTIPWQKPWTGGDHFPLTLPRNAATKNWYRGINIVLLWCSSLKNEFQSDEWASFKQWNERKEIVRKGEKGSLIVYYDTFEKEINGEIEKIPFLKSSYVFNKCQLKSFLAGEKENKPVADSFVLRMYDVDDFIENTQATVEHNGRGARYIPSSDTIVMPHMEQFQTTTTCTATEGYYSTLLHELTHWTGAKDRLNRVGGKKFGDDNYALEELVAEFGAAFLCAGFGMATLEKGDHAGYIENWLKVLKENKQFIFTAASEASKAVEYLNGLQPK